MKISIAIIGIVFVSCISSVRADDNKDASDAAYCVGEYQSEIDNATSMVDKKRSTKIIVGKKKKLRDVEPRQLLKEKIVNEAIRRGKLDTVTASKMKDAGYADGILCIQATEECLNDWIGRSDNKVDAELNKKQLTDCNKNTEPVCARALQNCE